MSERAVPVLYLDIDGTVREGKDDPLGRFVNGPADVRVFPEAVEMMRAEHPELARCWCRKPSAGAVVEAAHGLVEMHRGEFYPPYMGLLVGDRAEDYECAASAGLDFQWASEWRSAA